MGLHNAVQERNVEQVRNILHSGTNPEIKRVLFFIFFNLIYFFIFFIFFIFFYFFIFIFLFLFSFSLLTLFSSCRIAGLIISLSTNPQISFSLIFSLPLSSSLSLLSLLSLSSLSSLSPLSRSLSSLSLLSLSLLSLLSLCVNRQHYI